MKKDISKIRIVISVYGGVVNGITADREGAEIMIVDYDNEKGGEPRSSRSFEEPEIDVDYIERVIKGEE